MLLNDSHFKVLCDGMKKCPSLVSINVSNNDITHHGLKKMVPVTQNLDIEEFVLSNNKLGDPGVHLLFEILSKRRCKLVFLDISNCQLKCEGFLLVLKAIATGNKSSLKNLKMDGNNLNSFNRD